MAVLAQPLFLFPPGSSPVHEIITFICRTRAASPPGHCCSLSSQSPGHTAVLPGHTDPTLQLHQFPLGLSAWGQQAVCGLPQSPSPFHTSMLSPWFTQLTPCCSMQGAVCVPSSLPVRVHGTPVQPAPSACWIIRFLPFIQCRMPCLQLPANPCCCPNPAAELSPRQSSWQTQFACPPVLHLHPLRSSSHL